MPDPTPDPREYVCKGCGFTSCADPWCDYKFTKPPGWKSVRELAREKLRREKEEKGG